MNLRLKVAWSEGNNSARLFTLGKGKERKGKERKGKERKGKERKGKERKGKERKRKH